MSLLRPCSAQAPALSRLKGECAGGHSRKLLWLADTLASTADCGHHGENQNAGRSCVLLSEEGGKRWQIVYMSQVPLDDGEA